MFRYEILETADTKYLHDLLYTPDDELIVYPSCMFKDIDPLHIRQFCMEYGIYCLPTIELIEFLSEETKGKVAIEIGAGHGVIGRELGIISTDSFMQDREDVKRIYEILRQPTVRYGKNVLKHTANEAVEIYTPDVVIGAWVTHKINYEESCEGNIYGIEEEKIIDRCKYIFIGSLPTHSCKPILKIEHQTIEVDWIVSRAYQKDGCKDVIWIW